MRVIDDGSDDKLFLIFVTFICSCVTFFIILIASIAISKPKNTKSIEDLEKEKLELEIKILKDSLNLKENKK